MHFSAKIFFAPLSFSIQTHVRQTKPFAESSPIFFLKCLTHTHTHKRHPRSRHTLPLQSYLNQARINHCHGPAYSWPSKSNTGQRWRRGNKHDTWLCIPVCVERRRKHLSSIEGEEMRKNLMIFPFQQASQCSVPYVF